MKRTAFIAGIGALAALAIMGFRQANSGIDLLKSHFDALNKAESVKATYTVMPIGGAATSYTIQLAKPNMARIEKPSAIIVADGVNITFYDKNDNTYYKRAQTQAELNALFASDELSVWSPFFNADANKAVATAKALPNKNRKGIEFKVVEVVTKGKNNESTTFYINPADNIARQCEMTGTMDGQKSTRILDVKSLELNNAKDSALYAWNPPSGSNEIKEADLISDVWYTDFEEAKAAAKKSNRKMLVHFTAEWCGWCKKIEGEVYVAEEFKKTAKYFVFCKIDVDKNPSLKSAYNVGGIPDIRILDADGGELGKMVGYRPLDQFMAELNKYTH